MSTSTPRTPAWAWIGLGLILVFNVWWRGHTFGPTVTETIGLPLWPVVKGETEPLDCDEAAYAYMARRMVEHGDVLYRDLSENKPPAGYWIYALAVAIGGANEITIRLLPIPLVLATIALVWWLGLRLGGPAAACLAAFTYAVASTDPYIYGNGAQLSHAINLGSVAALALFFVATRLTHRAWMLVLSGLALGCSALVRPTSAMHLLVFLPAILIFKDRSVFSRFRDLIGLLFGFGAAWVVAILVLAGQGAWEDASVDIFQAGRAIVTDRAPDPNAPSPLIRWLTGNADPEGNLPPPFGRTTYLVWWGSGTWPLWVASVPALLWLTFGKTSGLKRILVAWTVSCWIQVILPGQYWPHYYLLPVPGTALAIALACADTLRLGIVGKDDARGTAPQRESSRSVARFGFGLLLLASLGGMTLIQVRDYLLLPSEELTIQHKGGRQWVALREFGRELKRRSDVGNNPTLLVWGWQSPLYFYSGFDAPSRHFFVNDLMRDHAGTDHPLIGPRAVELLTDLDTYRPDFISTGYAPFPDLHAFLRRNYLPWGSARLAPDGRGFWVRKDRYVEFESR